MKPLTLAIAYTLFSLTPVQAGEIDMLPFYHASAVQPASHAAARPKAKPRRYKPARRAEKRAKPAPVTTPPAGATDDATRCLAPVRVVGSQDIREAAAEESAKKAWAEIVRWSHGESFQDFANARDYQKRCSRSSIGEAMGQFFLRCEITASPCRPGMVRGAP
jgi:hypothetical protein